MPCPFRCPVVNEWKPPKPYFYYWSKAKMCCPKDSLKPEPHFKRQPFISVAERSKGPSTNMFSILSFEYGRQHQTESDKLRARICQAQEKHKQRIQKVMKNNPPTPRICVQAPQRFVMKRFQCVPAKTCSKGIDIKLCRKKGCVPRAPLPCPCDPKLSSRCPCRCK